MKTLSLDASTTCIGWSVWDEDKLLSCGKLIPTVPKLTWRDRIQNFIPQIAELILQYKITDAVVEDVPLIDKKGKLTLVQLGATQGSILGVFGAKNVPIQFINVSTCRKDIGLNDGTREGTKRENLKPHSVNLANEMFNLNLACTFSKKGNYNESKSDDDISDCILLYASTREKYKII